MKSQRFLARISLFSLGMAIPFLLPLRAQGPVTQGGETVAKKKKGDSTTTEDTTSKKIPSAFGKKDNLPQGIPVFRTDALTVTVDAAVLDNKGHFIPKIPRGNFRISEDGVPQEIKSFGTGEAPMTVALVVEFSAKFEGLWGPGWFDVLNTAYGFVQTLKPEDYLAVVAYDMRPEILSDFSTNRMDAQEALSRLRIPGFSEANMYDALVDTAQRMQDIEGRKAIVLLSSGIDTFSKLTYDKTRRALQEAGVPVYTISMLQQLRLLMGAAGDSIGWAQADLQMKTFANETGGMAFYPRFYQELGGVFQTIEQTMRSNYVMTYTPANQTRDGKFRKIKVDLINPETNQPLPIKDEKGKAIKYQIIAKTGYTAPRQVE